MWDCWNQLAVVCPRKSSHDPHMSVNIFLAKDGCYSQPFYRPHVRLDKPESTCSAQTRRPSAPTISCPSQKGKYANRCGQHQGCCVCSETRYSRFKTRCNDNHRSDTHIFCSRAQRTVSVSGHCSCRTHTFRNSTKGFNSASKTYYGSGERRNGTKSPQEGTTRIQCRDF